jgi:hypothetical protein
MTMKRQLAPYAATGTYAAPVAPSLSPWKRFMTWCEGQETDHHWLWTGLSMGLQGCVLSPLALWAIHYFQLPDVFLLGAVSFIFAVVIPNLSALSTKVIIPVFGLSTLFTAATVLTGILG